MKKGLLLVWVSVLWISCSTAEKSAVEEISNITSKIVNDPETVLVDVRIPEQYQKSTEKNTVNIPLAEIPDKLDFFKNRKQIVVFCNSGRQARQAIEILNNNGIKNVYNGINWNNITNLQNKKKSK